MTFEKWNKVFLWSCVVLIGLGQLTCTLLDQSFFPFCSYNMFNRAPNQVVQSITLRFHDADGKTFESSPGSLYPTEFFIAKQYLAGILGRRSKKELRASLERALERINSGGWQPFDEIEAPPPCAGSCVGIDLELRFYKVLPTGPELGQTVPVYSYTKGK